MAVHDTIGDFVTTIRNAVKAGKDSSTVSFSKLRFAIAQILKNEGFIRNVETIENNGIPYILISYKYVDGVSALAGLDRHSRPGCRMYYKYSDIPYVLGGLGTAVLTTSKGVLTDKDARREKVGGELLCTVW